MALEGIEYIKQAAKNPCPEGQHVYDDRISVIGNRTMLNQICTVCFNFNGWIYNWDARE